jgi:hypothetical protein
MEPVIPNAGGLYLQFNGGFDLVLLTEAAT